MVQINSGINQTNKINPNLKIHCLSGLATHYLYYVFELCSAFRGLQVIQGNFAFALSFWLISDLKILCVWYGLHASLQEILSRRNTCKDAERSSQSLTLSRWPELTFNLTVHNDQRWVKHAAGTRMNDFKRWIVRPPQKNTENGASSFTLKSLLSEQNVLLQFSCYCMWTNGTIVTKTSSASAAGVWPPSGVGERGQDHPRAESSRFGHDYWVNILTPDIIRLKRVFVVYGCSVLWLYRAAPTGRRMARKHKAPWMHKRPSDGLEIIC